MAVTLLVVNWLVWGAVCLSVGGTALIGEITNGRFFVRRHPSSPLVEVSTGFWEFSLFYSLLTFGGTVYRIVPGT